MGRLERSGACTRRRAGVSRQPGQRAREGSVRLSDSWLQPVRNAHESSSILGLRTIPGAVFTFCADKAVREWRDGEVRAGQHRALLCRARERDGPQLVRTVSAAEAASLAPPGLGADRQDRGLLHVRAGRAVWRSAPFALSCRRAQLDGLIASAATLSLLKHYRDLQAGGAVSGARAFPAGAPAPAAAAKSVWRSTDTSISSVYLFDKQVARPGVNGTVRVGSGVLAAQAACSAPDAP
jgi:hypothetical protein